MFVLILSGEKLTTSDTKRIARSTLFNFTIVEWYIDSMNEEKPKAKSKTIFKVLGITLAWISLPAKSLPKHRSSDCHLDVQDIAFFQWP